MQEDDQSLEQRILSNNKPIGRCLWCKYGAINNAMKQIYCHKLDKFCDKDNSCDKWRYCG